MGRKPVNDFEETSIANVDGSEFTLFHVKLPFAVEVTFDDKIGHFNDGSIRYGTGTEIVYKTMNDEDEIRTYYESKGCIKIKIKPWTVRLTNICPVCMTDGFPRIEHKDNKDNRLRNWKHKDQRDEPLLRKPEEYWLVYSHNKTRSKCRVSKCVSTPHPALQDNMKYEISMQRYLFPMCLEWMKDTIYKNS